MNTELDGTSSAVLACASIKPKVFGCKVDAYTDQVVVWDDRRHFGHTALNPGLVVSNDVPVSQATQRENLRVERGGGARVTRGN